MPTGYVKEAFESIPGNEANSPTLSAKSLFPPIQTFQPKPGAKPLSRDDELRNQDEPLPVIPDAFEPNWEYKSRLYPDLAGWRLKHVCGPPVTTVGNGIITDPDGVVIPTGAFRHVFAAPFGPAGANPVTAAMIAAYRDQAFFAELRGAACASLALETPAEGGANVQASGPALFMKRLEADPALTPAFETLGVRPFVRGGLSLQWLSGSASHDDFTVSIANPVEAARTMGIASKFPDVMEKGNEGPIVVSGTIPQRLVDKDDYDALINSTGFAAVAKWVNDSLIAATNYPYKLFLAMSNCQYVDGDLSPLANQRRIGASYSWKSTSASTGSTTITLVNATASYA